MKSPKVTVLMSVYNDERYLSESVDSILNQTYKDFEFLIINDGSTDRSREILESYSDPRIRLVRNDGNIGLTRSLNKGLALAMGEYIARMDADDISLPERLEKQVGFLDADSSVGVLGINSLLIDEDGNVLEKLQRPVTHDSIMAEMLTENRFVHSSVMLRKKLLKMSGYYDEKLDMAQDYELFL
ncbi:MAG TPA: glycosyltransferase, partial [candidate division Zixibacteria bacterium]|nr:glycosyltransferase [candidate division Zixibacteria bacterium]